MANLLKSGAAWLARQLAAHASVPIRYRRGGAVICETVATLGATRVQHLGDDGLVMEANVRDYLILRANLIDGDDQPIIPQERDEIAEVDGDGLLIHEVLPIDGKRAGDESDPYRQMWRIHTKFARAE